MAASDLCDLLESIEVVESFECSGVFLENLLHILNNNGNEQWTKLFEKALTENVYDRVYF